MTVSPEAFLSAAPKSVSGSSPWSTRYASELRRVFLDHAARAPRTLQSHLGPSEIGAACSRQVVAKLAALPVTNHVSDPWPSIRGTALHAWAEEAFKAENIRQGLLRWVTEQKVTPHPEHPGTADLYDAQEQAVVDWKFLGESSMAKVRKEWPRHYKVQLLLYGLGYALLGLPVRRVVLAAVPATASTLDGMYVSDHDFADENGRMYADVVELLNTVFDETAERKTLAQRLLAGEITLRDVPATPSGDACFFCGQYRPEASRDGGPGCPGTKAMSA